MLVVGRLVDPLLQTLVEAVWLESAEARDPCLLQSQTSVDSYRVVYDSEFNAVDAVVRPVEVCRY